MYIHYKSIKGNIFLIKTTTNNVEKNEDEIFLKWKKDGEKKDKEKAKITCLIFSSRDGISL